MAIHHLISGPVTVLTPSHNGKVYVRYQSGRLNEVDVTELIADNGTVELSATLAAIAENWNWNEWETPAWHVQATLADTLFNCSRAPQYLTLQRDEYGRPLRGELPNGTVESWEYEGPPNTQTAVFTRD